MPRRPSMDSPGLRHRVWFRAAETWVFLQGELEREKFRSQLAKAMGQAAARPRHPIMNKYVILTIRWLSYFLASVAPRLLTELGISTKEIGQLLGLTTQGVLQAVAHRPGPFETTEVNVEELFAKV